MKPVLIYPPTVDWDHLHQRPQQLIKAASKNGAIGIFCNPNQHRRHSTGIEFKTPSLVLANNMQLGDTIRWARAAFPNEPICVIFSYPPQTRDVLRAGADFVIFDTLDEPVGEFAHWMNGYADAARDAELVIASATSLKERAQQYRTDEVELIPNGCDYEHFRTAQTRTPINEAPFNTGRKIAGFFGAVATWLDWELIRHTAAALPTINFVFIGEPYGFVSPPMGATNCFFIGMRDYEELPKYLSNFDVCTIPFKINEMTRGVSPIKMWEYLASGIPVISTPLPEAMRTRGVTVCDHRTYIQEIQRAVDWREREQQEKLDGSTFRMYVAKTNSWDSRAKQLLQAIGARMSARTPAPVPTTTKLYRKKAIIEVVEKRPDGYLVQIHGDPSDRWVIPTKTFEDTYEEA